MKKLFFLLAIVLSLSIVSVEASARDVVASPTFQTEVSAVSFYQPNLFVDYNFCQRTDVKIQTISDVVQLCVLTDEVTCFYFTKDLIFNLQDLTLYNKFDNNVSYNLFKKEQPPLLKNKFNDILFR